MKKRKTKKTKNTNQKSPKFYFLGIVVLLALIAFGIYKNSKNEITLVIHDYVTNKQEIQDRLGNIQTISYQNKPWFVDTHKTYDIALNLKGSKAHGVLTLKAQFHDPVWQLSHIKLIIQKQKYTLQPVYVSQTQLFAASVSSSPVNTPVFLQGEQIYLQLRLKGIPQNQNGIHISESLDLYDQNNSLVSANPNVAKFSGDHLSNPKKGLRFTNKVSDFSPGDYFLQLTFKDNNNQILETYWQKIKINPSQNQLFVRSVNYFSDPGRHNKKDALFHPNQMIYLSLTLDGFKVKDSKISGIVDLRIQNSEGETIAYEPKFAAFTQDHDPERNITVDGEFKIKDPDIYFLSFRIQDYFSKDYITHQEKVIVSLK